MPFFIGRCPSQHITGWGCAPSKVRPHGVDPFERQEGRLAWRCPSDDRFIALFGQLAEDKTV